MYIQICEVSPRDGLQNHPVDVSTDDKIVMIDTLSQCGFTSIEVTSFVSPKWVPKMADGGEVMQGITRLDNINYIVLTPNQRGMENALNYHPDSICIFPSATEAFSKRNLNATKQQAFDRFARVAKLAHAHNIKIRGSLSCAGFCPYVGVVSPRVIADDVQKLLDMGCHTISLADTVGGVTGDMSRAVLDTVLKYVNPHRVFGHFHDTRGYALDNVDAYMDAGVTAFDGAILGLGGCPFAKGATGNVNTRKLVTHLHATGHTTNICVDTLIQAEKTIQKFV